MARFLPACGTDRRIVTALLVCAAAAGCGSNIGGSGTQTLLLSDCPDSTGAKMEAADVVLLNWDGGVSNILPDDELSALDLSVFQVLEGGTLADDAAAFKDAVRAEAARILCDMPTEGVRLLSGKADLGRPVTTVFLAQMLSPTGRGQIGQGEYDPCNTEHDNDAVIFGEELLGLGGAHSFDGWVQIFANVTAHEVGHTLGYPHVPRVVYSDAERPLFVELMLATHTVDEMLAQQRYLADEDNCPSDPATAHLRGADAPDGVFICRMSAGR